MDVTVPMEVVKSRIYLIRGHKVLLSYDLANLYDVEPRVLVQAVKRNPERFPPDFMFQLTDQEFRNLKSQFVTSSWGGIRRAAPYAFTEQGVAMLSSVLNSGRAVQVNIAIMRAFVQMRELAVSNRELARKIEELEQKHARHDRQFIEVFEAIRQLIKPLEKKDRKEIGFKVEEGGAAYR